MLNIHGISLWGLAISGGSTTNKHLRLRSNLKIRSNDVPYIESSAINWVEYDKSTKLLLITFKSGKTYTYYNVPEMVYVAFLESSSKGTYFNENIKDSYSFA